MSYPFFYAKIDTVLLDSCCIDQNTIRVHNKKPPFNTYFNLPLPCRQYSKEFKVDKERMSSNIINDIGLNRKYAFLNEDYLNTGVLSEFDGVDGVWCLITHCSICFREFLGLVSGMRDTYYCNTPNCANNITFRNKMKTGNRFIGTL